MKDLSRRQFLLGAAWGSAAVTVGFGGPGLFGRVLYADGEGPFGREGRTLVLLELAGGNDGLNTVVPYADDRYYRSRPILGVKRREVLRLDDHVGLHPSLAGLARLYEAGRAAIVNGVGYPNPNRSHFESMDIWHSGRLDPAVAAASTGWLGRWLDGAESARRARIPALALASRLPRALSGSRVAVPAIDDPAGFGAGPEGGAPLESLLRREPEGDGSSELDFLRRASGDALRSAEEIRRLATDVRTTVEYPATGLAGALRFVARAIDSDLGARLFFVSLGGFDTHAGQDVSHPQLLAELGGALEAFVKDLDRMDRTKEVLVLAFSEFGRRLAENASAGTDHGAAGPVLLVSGALSGGLHGAVPDLGALADGDLRYGVDFRSVYAAVLQDWLEADAAGVLGEGVEPLGHLFA